MTEPGTVTAQLEELERRGFGANLGVVSNAVQVLSRGKTFKAEELAIREYHRFENVSDPAICPSRTVGAALRDVRILRQEAIAS